MPSPIKHVNARKLELLRAFFTKIRPTTIHKFDVKFRGINMKAYILSLFFRGQRCKYRSSLTVLLEQVSLEFPICAEFIEHYSKKKLAAHFSNYHNDKNVFVKKPQIPQIEQIEPKKKVVTPNQSDSSNMFILPPPKPKKQEPIIPSSIIYVGLSRFLIEEELQLTQQIRSLQQAISYANKRLTDSSKNILSSFFSTTENSIKKKRQKKGHRYFFCVLKKKMLSLCQDHITILAFTDKQGCGACKMLEPELLALHNVEGVDFHFEQVDSSEKGIEPFRQFGIQYVPSILFFVPSKQKFFLYNSDRNVNTIQTCAILKDHTCLDEKEWTMYTPFQLSPHEKTIVSSSNVSSVTAVTTDVLNIPKKLLLCMDKPTVFVFSGLLWCPACRRKQNRIDELLGNQTSVYFLQFDLPDTMDVLDELIGQFQIQSYPTILVFDPKTKSFSQFNNSYLDEILTETDGRMQPKYPRAMWNAVPPVEVVDCKTTTTTNPDWQLQKMYMSKRLQQLIETKKLIKARMEAELQQQQQQQQMSQMMQQRQVEDAQMERDKWQEAAVALRRQQDQMVQIQKRITQQAPAPGTMSGSCHDMSASCHDMSSVHKKEMSAPCPDMMLPLTATGNANNAENVIIMNMNTARSLFSQQPQISSQPQPKDAFLSFLQKPSYGCLRQHSFQLSQESMSIEFCATCKTILIFTGITWCGESLSLKMEAQELIQEQSCENGFHVMCCDYTQFQSTSDNSMCDLFEIMNFPTVLVFNPEYHQFYKFNGLHQKHDLRQSQKMFLSPIDTPQHAKIILIRYRPLKNNHTQTKQSREYRHHHDNGAMTQNVSGRLRLCNKHLTVLIFSFGSNDAHVHLKRHDGNEIHILHFNTKEHPFATQSFRINAYPHVLVFDPQLNLFFVYNGDMDNIAAIKKTCETQTTRNVWNSFPQVVLTGEEDEDA